MTSAPVIVGVDRSDGARLALGWAVEEGRLRGVAVEALAAWSFLDQQQLSGQDFDPAFDEAAAAAALHEIVAEAGGDVVERVVNDLPARALVEASEGADLVVVGSRGLGAVRGRLIGSVSDQVVRHARAPVAVIRDPAADGATDVVVGYDGSPNAEAALQWATDEAARRGATLRKVEAESDPGDALVEAAQTAALLVVGARGKGGFAGLRLGSTAMHLLHHAPGPLVVVPAED